MDLLLVGKKALVLGGSSGIGYAVAESLVAEGAKVVLAAREANRLQSAGERLRQSVPSADVEMLTVDVSKESSLREALSPRAESFDILINNVGGPATGQVMTIDLAGWDAGYQSLLRSTVLLAQLLAPGMKARGWGRILSITSTSAVEMIPGLPVSGVFRAGLSALAKSLSRDLGPHGVLVNNLLPGPTNTGRLADLEKKSPEFFRSMREETSLKRVAEPNEIGRVAAFLCSGANTYITGTDILADGGYTKAY